MVHIWSGAKSPSTVNTWLFMEWRTILLNQPMTFAYQQWTSHPAKPYPFQAAFQLSLLWWEGEEGAWGGKMAEKQKDHLLPCHFCNTSKTSVIGKKLVWKLWYFLFSIKNRKWLSINFFNITEAWEALQSILNPVLEASACQASAGFAFSTFQLKYTDISSASQASLVWETMPLVNESLVL